MIESAKLSQQNIRFGIKLFLSYIAFTLILVFSIVLIYLYFSHDVRAKQFAREVKLQSMEKKDKFDTHLKTKQDALLAISKNSYFLDYIRHGTNKNYVDLLFLTIMEANKDYMQIRYIDANGQEILRFDRNKASSKAYKVQSLQDKSQRSYFKTASKMEKGTVFVSSIDLNVEHEHVEIPYKAVVRFSVPLYLNNTFAGVLVINVFMDDVLKNLTTSTLYDIYVLDENRYYIHHKNSAFNWSLYGSKRKADHDFDSILIKKMKNTNNLGFIDNQTFIQPLWVGDQKITMIMVENSESIKKMESGNHKMIFTVVILAFILSLIFTLFFTKTLNSIFELVTAQGDKLHDLATELDSKVKLKSMEILRKDRLLQHQSKLAELGEMIANITHQWKQPLTRLSLIVQNLKAFKEKSKMSDELFVQSLQSALDQIEFMSNTVDDFKNFYKPDETPSEFLITDAVDHILKIIGVLLEQSTIKFSMHSQEALSLNVSKNEFMQVLMSIIMNAKDAIVGNGIVNGEITISLTAKNHQKVIEISDNGGGIEEEVMPQIFDPYFTTKHNKGSGIGLYMSKTIIESKMGGKLYARNSKYGTIFTIVL